MGEALEAFDLPVNRQALVSNLTDALEAVAEAGKVIVGETVFGGRRTGVALPDGRGRRRLPEASIQGADLAWMRHVFKVRIEHGVRRKICAL